MADKFSSKQQVFINAYLSNGFNATHAAIEAGYSGVTARQQGSRLLTNVDIKQEINTRLTDYAMPANEVLARLADHARGDMREIIGATLEELRTHPRGNLVKKVKMGVMFDNDKKRVDYVESMELYDAQAALVQLARVHGLLTDKHEITGADGGAIPILVTGMNMDEL